MTQHPQNDLFNDGHSLTNAIDHLILMHRECHFGGHFPTMIDYYEKEGKGVSEEFSLEDIHRLSTLESQMQQNLAALLLTGPEIEKIAQSRDLYKKLRAFYEKETPTTKIPRLIADLILSERETEDQDIEAIVAEKQAIVPALIELLRSEDLHDPLFPGYGLTPALASKCLGLIGDKRAIISLFESIGGIDVFDEETTLKALKSIGEPAKEFLLRILRGRPLTYDTERSAIALVSFKDDEEVAQACLKILQEQEVLSNLSLAPYLILTCEGLKNPADQKALKELLNHPKLPKELALDIRSVIQSWENHS